MNRESWKEVFAPDSGMLLDIMVFDTDIEDCRSALAFISSSFRTKYLVDDVPAALPDIEAVFTSSANVHTRLEISLSGVLAVWHFWSAGWIEIDILPEDVQSTEHADAVFDFMSKLATAIGKPVFLTPEHGSASDEERRSMAVCCADPGGGSVQFRSPHLIAVTESDFRCSECSDWKMKIEKQNSTKSEAEWQQFIGREFQEHVKRRHTSSVTD